MHRGIQTAVAEWMRTCLPEGAADDDVERTHRFLEEALELAQAAGCDRAAALELLDYVFDRPVGTVDEEVGGVTFTLAALCNSLNVDLQGSSETELQRNWSRRDAIRRKHEARPEGSARPQ